MPTILVFRDWYLPGFQGGGTIRSLSNVVEHLGDEFDFRVITRIRDHLSETDYPGVEPFVWQKVGKAQVVYLPVNRLSPLTLRKVVKGIEYHLILLTSAKSVPFALYPLMMRKFGMLARVPIVISPKGELANIFDGKMRARQSLMRAVIRYSGLYSRCYWQATSQHERESFIRILGTRARIIDAPELPDPIEPSILNRAPKNKAAGRIRLAYLSRITRPKNLLFALQAIARLRGDVTFDIFGPVQDATYWSECEAAIGSLPPNIVVHKHGSVKMSEAVQVLTGSDLFVFPSISESFGYVIFEALLAGCPVVIGTGTPWQGLASRGIGHDLPLDDPARFAAVIQEYIDMPADRFEECSQRAFAAAVNLVNERTGLKELRDLFNTALAQG